MAYKRKIWKIIIRVLSVLLAFVLLVIGLTLSPAIYSTPPPFEIDSITITAHRGAAAYAPENSMAAIRKGILSSAQRIEIDIQQTNDGGLVVMHDDSIDRTTSGSGEVSHLSLAELSQFRIDINPAFANEKIPTLEEVLREVAGRKLLVIEIKQSDRVSPGITKRTVDLIHQLNATSWCIIHSFSDEVLQAVHQLDPNITLHKCFVCQTRVLPLMIDMQLNWKSPSHYPYVKEFSIHYLFANRAIIREIHALGKKINVWTIDDPDIAKKLVSLDVDGLITDQPDEILK